MNRTILCTKKHWVQSECGTLLSHIVWGTQEEKKQINTLTNEMEYQRHAADNCGHTQVADAATAAQEKPDVPSLAWKQNLSVKLSSKCQKCTKVLVRLKLQCLRGANISSKGEPYPLFQNRSDKTMKLALSKYTGNIHTCASSTIYRLPTTTRINMYSVHKGWVFYVFTVCPSHHCKLTYTRTLLTKKHDKWRHNTRMHQTQKRNAIKVPASRQCNALMHWKQEVARGCQNNAFELAQELCTTEQRHTHCQECNHCSHYCCIPRELA